MYYLIFNDFLKILATGLDKLLGNAPTKQDLQSIGSNSQGATQQQISDLT